jgi:hypothetical protein
MEADPLNRPLRAAGVRLLPSRMVEACVPPKGPMGIVLLLRGLGSSPSKRVAGTCVRCPCRIIVLSAVSMSRRIMASEALAS